MSQTKHLKNKSFLDHVKIILRSQICDLVISMSVIREWLKYDPLVICHNCVYFPSWSDLSLSLRRIKAVSEADENDLSMIRLKTFSRKVMYLNFEKGHKLSECDSLHIVVFLRSFLKKPRQNFA